MPQSSASGWFHAKIWWFCIGYFILSWVNFVSFSHFALVFSHLFHSWTHLISYPFMRFWLRFWLFKQRFSIWTFLSHNFEIFPLGNTFAITFFWFGHHENLFVLIILADRNLFWFLTQPRPKQRLTRKIITCVSILQPKIELQTFWPSKAKNSRLLKVTQGSNSW